MAAETPIDHPAPRGLKVYAFSDGQGHPFDVVASSFSEANELALQALDRKRLPVYRGLNMTLPGGRRIGAPA